MQPLRRVDPHQDRAAYRQIADDLREQITSGLIDSGSLLPSEERIGQMYGTGRLTARQAVRVLRDEGLLVAETGIGIRVVESMEARVVEVGPGDEITWRIATADDRDAGVAEGTPLAVISHPGQPERLHPTAQLKIRVTDPSDSHIAT